jgi:hypothetical protein
MFWLEKLMEREKCGDQKAGKTILKRTVRNYM